MAARAARLTPAQWLLLVLGLHMVVLGIAGLAVNPDFATGDSATAERWEWLDWNGWHAVGTLLLAATAFMGLANARLATGVLAYIALINVVTGTWSVLDDRPASLLYLPSSGDTVLHFAYAAIAAAGVAFDVRSRRGRVLAT